MSGTPTDPVSKVRALSGGVRLVVRQLRSDPVLVSVVVAIVFVTAIILSAAPQLLNRMSDAALRQTLEEALPPVRNVSVGRTDRLASLIADEPFDQVDRVGRAFSESEMPESVMAIVEDQKYVVDSPRFVVLAPPGRPQSPFPTFITFRHHQDVADHIRLVDGRLPQTRTPIETVLEEGGEPETIPVYEIAVTAQTLSDMRANLGDPLFLRPDHARRRGIGMAQFDEDPLYRDVPLALLDYTLGLEVVGIVEPIEPNGAYWFDDTRLHQPRIMENPDFRWIIATGMMAPSDFQRLLEDTSPADWSHSWRYYIDPGLVDAGSLDALTDDIRDLQSSHSASPDSVFRKSSFRVTTGLTGLIGDFLHRQGLVFAVLSMASIGILLVSLGTLAALTGLIASRQRDSIILLRSRGVSRRQLLLAQLVEGVLLSAPAALAGYWISVNLVPGRANPLSWQAAIALSTAVTLLVVLAKAPLIYRDLASLDNGTAIWSKAPTRRVVAEILVVAVALAALVLLRRRGLSTADGASMDPLLAATPALLGLAAAIFTMRLYAYPLSLLARIGSSGRGVVLHLGIKRVLTQARAATVSLIVVLLGASTAVLAMTLDSSIGDGQSQSAWQSVGADFRLTSTTADDPLPLDLDLSALVSIEERAYAVGLVNVPVSSDSSDVPGRVHLLALATDDYNRVTAGSGADAQLPAELVERQNVAGIGTFSNPIPAVISGRDIAGAAPSSGQRFSVSLEQSQVHMIVIEARDTFPGQPPGRPFAVVNLDSLSAVGANVALSPTVLYLRAPDGTLNQIESAIRGQTPYVAMTSRALLYDQIRNAPFASEARVAFRLALVLGSTYALIAAVAALFLTSRSRNRDYGYLRPLGLAKRQIRLLAAIEQLPSFMILASIGAAVGVGGALAIAPGLDLGAIAGGGFNTEMHPSVGGTVLLFSSLVVAFLLALALYLRLSPEEFAGRRIESE